MKNSINTKHYQFNVAASGKEQNEMSLANTNGTAENRVWLFSWLCI